MPDQAEERTRASRVYQTVAATLPRRGRGATERRRHPPALTPMMYSPRSTGMGWAEKGSPVRGRDPGREWPSSAGARAPGDWAAAPAQEKGRDRGQSEVVREPTPSHWPFALLHRHRLGQVARLVDVATPLERSEVGEELQRDDHGEGI
jgi:hypothetical protein